MATDNRGAPSMQEQRLRRPLLYTLLTSGNDVPHTMIGGPSGAGRRALVVRVSLSTGGACMRADADRSARPADGAGSRLTRRCGHV
jgi:hypothetical protein